MRTLLHLASPWLVPTCGILQDCEQYSYMSMPTCRQGDLQFSQLSQLPFETPAYSAILAYDCTGAPQHRSCISTDAQHLSCNSTVAQYAGLCGNQGGTIKTDPHVRKLMCCDMGPKPLVHVPLVHVEFKSDLSSQLKFCSDCLKFSTGVQSAIPCYACIRANPCPDHTHAAPGLGIQESDKASVSDVLHTLSRCLKLPG